MSEVDVKTSVREHYAQAATGSRNGCGCCCGGGDLAETISKAVGYSDAELGAVPEGANLGLGCGNPVALASLAPGETVVDLGAGAGFDCFLAARKVGDAGRVIGVDMTPEMIEKARANAEKGGYANVEFRQGDIEALPVQDDTADAIISNCVINLAPDKAKVFAEAFRVLRPGGRLMVSDIVLLQELPEAIRESAAAYTACIAGALLKGDYLAAVQGAGFVEVEVAEQAGIPVQLLLSDPTIQPLLDQVKDLSPEAITRAVQSVVSIKVHAVKPGQDT